MRLYVIGADDPELARYQRVAAIAFAHPGGRVDVREAPLDTSAEARARTAALRERIASGRTVMMVAVENGEPVAVGYDAARAAAATSGERSGTHSMAAGTPAAACSARAARTSSAVTGPAPARGRAG